MAVCGRASGREGACLLSAHPASSARGRPICQGHSWAIWQGLCSLRKSHSWAIWWGLRMGQASCFSLWSLPRALCWFLSGAPSSLSHRQIFVM